MTVRTALATVCVSGTLEDKLAAAAHAGFDGVEIFEPDLVASAWSPREIARRCADLGLSIDLYQPFRDFDSTDPQRLAASRRRAARKFGVMRELGTDLVLVCSSVAEDAVADVHQLAEQLHGLAELAAEEGVRLCYEALAWGRHVNLFEQSWDAVRAADHPALGLCLDSFHILSRGSDPTGILDVPGEKIFFLQLADAPHLDMDVLQWSRHHRLFPGQGAFDLPHFLSCVLTAGYTGPLSLEVFNDVFRQTDPERAAVDARRSLLALAEATHDVLTGPARDALAGVVPDRLPRLDGFAFTELAVEEPSRGRMETILSGLGMHHTGTHRSKPVHRWESGSACLLVNTHDATGLGDDHPVTGAAVSAIGVRVDDPTCAAVRAETLLAPRVPRSRGSAEADLSAVAAPDGTVVFFCRDDGRGDGGWRADFVATADAASPPAPTAGAITHIDHVAMTQPYDRFDEATLFYRTVLGLHTHHTSEVAAPFGLIRNRAIADDQGSVRIGLAASVLRRGDWHPGVSDPQHVALATDDAIAAARRLQANGVAVLPIPANYYDDLDARLGLDPDRLVALQAANVMLDRDSHGEFLHFYTEIIGGRVFFEIVQRVGGYTGYGEFNAPVRMAAHRRRHRRPSAD